jgi:hypothetical protein
VQHPFQLQDLEAELPRWDRSVAHESSHVRGKLWRICKFEGHAPPAAGHCDDGVARAKQERDQVEVVAAEVRLHFFLKFFHFGASEESNWD